jgi:hypothetical protein
MFKSPESVDIYKEIGNTPVEKKSRSGGLRPVLSIGVRRVVDKSTFVDSLL